MTVDIDPLPRQLSAHLEDATYDGKWAHMDLVIRLDEREVSNVIRYDMDAGWLDHYLKDAQGHTVMEGDRLKQERLTGTITVTPRAPVL